MALKLITFEAQNIEADGASAVGKTFNVYGTYANALAHGSTGLSTINALDVLTGSSGSSITQVAKTTGVDVDNNGKVNFFADDGGSSQEYYLMSVGGRQGVPTKVIAQ